MNRSRSPLQRRLHIAGWLVVCLILLGGVAGMTRFGAVRPGADAPETPPGELPSPTARLAIAPAKKKLTAEELRKLYPFESLTARLEYETRRGESTAAPKLSAEAAKRLEETDNAWNPLIVVFNLRAASLQELHSGEVEKFIQREGFGVGRMLSPTPSYLPLEPAPAIPFTASGAHLRTSETGPKVALSKGEAPAATGPEGTIAPLPTLLHLDTFHLQGQNNFISLGSLGYIKDRDHVAGFQAHQFRVMPRFQDAVAPAATPPEETWAIARLELVSLLKHEKPAVYISEELPRMEQLKKAKTRPLDEFEAEALKRLRKGEDVVAEASLNHIRMMGSLRAAKQCLECHSASRGELLGTFSYVIQRVPPRTPVK